MHQNTSFCAELNGEHAGEGRMPLQSIILEIRTREVKKNHEISENLTFDLPKLGQILT